MTTVSFKLLPTIQYIIEQGGKIVLFSHLGKVKEESDKAKLTFVQLLKTYLRN